MTCLTVRDHFKCMYWFKKVVSCDKMMSSYRTRFNIKPTENSGKLFHEKNWHINILIWSLGTFVNFGIFLSYLQIRSDNMSFKTVESLFNLGYVFGQKLSIPAAYLIPFLQVGSLWKSNPASQPSRHVPLTLLQKVTSEQCPHLSEQFSP